MIALLLLATGALGQGYEVSEKMLKGIDMYNFRVKCWGEKNVDLYSQGLEAAKKQCMQTEPSLEPVDLLSKTNRFNTLTNNPFEALRSGGDLSKLPSLWRTRRSAESQGVIGVSDRQFYEFLGEVQDHRHSVASRMSNLTCVMRQTKMLTEENEINLKTYTTDLTEESEDEEGVVFDEEGTAAVDPEWRQRISGHYQECYDLSQNWPAASLLDNAVSRSFGRHIIFFKCANKMERKMCAEAQMLEWLAKLYGEKSPEELAEQISVAGLPEDKYEAASVTMAVLDNQASDEEKFVDDFMWGLNNEVEL